MLTATPTFAAPVEATAVGWIEFHPRYRVWLGKCGVRTAADALALRGEVVGGHADRHVVKVELHSGVSVRGAYLKREHLVARRSRLRNWREGFGWISRAEREAETLQKLEELGLPGPQWLAHGEDAAGRAFLLIEELTGAVPLREYLADTALTADEFRLLAERLGMMVAEYHAAGVGTPELAAKHVLLRPGALQPILIDWQSGRNDRAVSPADSTAWFGALHATLSEECAAFRDRLRVLWAYRRVLKACGIAPSLTFGKWVRAVRAASAKQSKRSSVQQQLSTTGTPPQRLVWLNGEAMVAIPKVAFACPKHLNREPLYDLPPGTQSITLPCGTIGELTRFRSLDPFGRLLAAIRERPWRSPGAKAARVCFHLQRFGVSGPKLLAFGQRRKSAFEVQSFVVVETGTVRGIGDRIAGDHPERNQAFIEIGQVLKRLHDARCRFHRTLLGADPLLILTPGLSVASASAVSIVRGVSERNARSDLAAALVGLDRLDKIRVLRAYLGSNAAERSTWARFAEVIL